METFELQQSKVEMETFETKVCFGVTWLMMLCLVPSDLYGNVFIYLQTVQEKV